MKDYLDAQNLLKPCLDKINSLQGNFSHIETLRIFYLVLHISCSSFGLGQVRHSDLDSFTTLIYLSILLLSFRSNHQKMH